MRKIKLKIKKIDKMPSQCKEYQALFKDYVWGKLPFDVEKNLVRHVRKCSDCMDDLKDYFMFSTALRYLENSDKDINSSDVNELLVETEKKELEIFRRKRTIALGTSMLLLLAAFLVLIFYTDYLGGF